LGEKARKQLGDFLERKPNLETTKRVELILKRINENREKDKARSMSISTWS